MVAVLVHGVMPFGVAITVALALYTTIPLAVFLLSSGWRFYPSGAFRLWVMRPFWYVQLLLPLVALSAAIGLIVGAPFGQSLLVARWLAGTIASAMVLLFIAGYVGSRRLVVHELEAWLPTLPVAFDGMTIAHISDLHVGPHTSRRYLRRIRNAVTTLEPDLIVVNGDLVDDRSEDVEHYAAAFRDITAPLGVFITMGNHEIYSGWDDVEQRLSTHRLGTLLVNDARALQRAGETIHVISTGDPAALRDAPHVAPDIDRTLAGVPSDATVIALVHNPALWPALAKRGVALTLSGHTHWGQFALPRAGWSLASPFLQHAMGAYRNGDALLYISPGTGYFGIPFRIGAPGEVALVRLRRGPAAIRDSGTRRWPRPSRISA